MIGTFIPHTSVSGTGRGYRQPSARLPGALPAWHPIRPFRRRDGGQHAKKPQPHTAYAYTFVFRPARQHSPVRHGGGTEILIHGKFERFRDCGGTELSGSAYGSSP